MERYGTGRLGPTINQKLGRRNGVHEGYATSDGSQGKAIVPTGRTRRVTELAQRRIDPVFIGHKAHLTALVLIRRHLIGHRGARKWTSPDHRRKDLTYILEEWDG